MQPLIRMTASRDEMILRLLVPLAWPDPRRSPTASTTPFSIRQGSLGMSDVSAGTIAAPRSKEGGVPRFGVIAFSPSAFRPLPTLFAQRAEVDQSISRSRSHVNSRPILLPACTILSARTESRAAFQNGDGIEFRVGGQRGRESVEERVQQSPASVRLRLIAAATGGTAERTDTRAEE
jgi:hypothetical protein